MVIFIRESCIISALKVKVKSAACYPVRSGEIGRMGVRSVFDLGSRRRARFLVCCKTPHESLHGDEYQGRSLSLCCVFFF